MTFANACTRLNAGTIRTHFEANIASALVWCHAFSVLAVIFAKCYARAFGFLNETF